jgi:hypothetical protein
VVNDNVGGKCEVGVHRLWASLEDAKKNEMH